MNKNIYDVRIDFTIAKSTVSLYGFTYGFGEKSFAIDPEGVYILDGDKHFFYPMGTIEMVYYTEVSKKSKVNQVEQ